MKICWDRDSLKKWGSCWDGRCQGLEYMKRGATTIVDNYRRSYYVYELEQGLWSIEFFGKFRDDGKKTKVWVIGTADEVAELLVTRARRYNCGYNTRIPYNIVDCPGGLPKLAVWILAWELEQT